MNDAWFAGDRLSQLAPLSETGVFSRTGFDVKRYRLIRA